MSSLAAACVGCLGMLAFFVGLLVRLRDALVGSDSRSLRERHQQRRRVRSAVRVPATDVPLAGPLPDPPEDDDPDVSGIGG